MSGLQVICGKLKYYNVTNLSWHVYKMEIKFAGKFSMITDSFKFDRDRRKRYNGRVWKSQMCSGVFCGVWLYLSPSPSRPASTRSYCREGIFTLQTGRLRRLRGLSRAITSANHPHVRPSLWRWAGQKCNSGYGREDHGKTPRRAGLRRRWVLPDGEGVGTRVNEGNGRKRDGGETLVF